MDARTLHEPLGDCAADGEVAQLLIEQIIELGRAFTGLTLALVLCAGAWLFVNLIKWIVK